MRVTQMFLTMLVTGTVTGLLMDFSVLPELQNWHRFAISSAVMMGGCLNVMRLIEVKVKEVE